MFAQSGFPLSPVDDPLSDVNAFTIAPTSIVLPPANGAVAVGAFSPLPNDADPDATPCDAAFICCDADASASVIGASSAAPCATSFAVNNVGSFASPRETGSPRNAIGVSENDCMALLACRRFRTASQFLEPSFFVCEKTQTADDGDQQQRHPRNRCARRSGIILYRHGNSPRRLSLWSA